MKKKTVLVKGIVIAIAVLLSSIVVQARFQTSSEQLATASDVSGEGPYAYTNPDISSIKSILLGGKETCVGGKCVTSGGRVWNTLQVGHVGENKRVVNTHKVSVSSLPGDEYGVIETNVTVSRLDYTDQVSQTIQAKALVFSDLDEEADVGYIFVNREQAEVWIKVLNGNPSYVFGGGRIQTHRVENLITGQVYTAYNLAEIAVESGGAGNRPPGDGLTRLNNDLYFKQDGFYATPRPTRDISLDSSAVTTTSFLSFFASPTKEAPIEPQAPEIVFLPSAAGLTLVSRDDAFEMQNEIKALSKIDYLDAQGRPMKVELVFIIAEDHPDKAALMLVDDAAQVIYAPVAFDISLEKPEGIIHVGPEVGRITRVEGNRRFFQLYAEIQKVKADQQERSFTLY